MRVIGKVLWMEKSMLTKCGPVMLFFPILKGARFKQPVLPAGVFGLFAGAHWKFEPTNEFTNEVGMYGSVKQDSLIQFGFPGALPEVLTGLHPGSRTVGPNWSAPPFPRPNGSP